MKIFKTIASFAFAAGVFLSSSVFADTVKIAFIDPLSGPFATTGTGGLAQWKFAVEKLVNEKGGVLGGKKMENFKPCIDFQILELNLFECLTTGIPFLKYILYPSDNIFLPT